MDRLLVSGSRREELVGLLVRREGLDRDTARHFLDLAVQDLIESYRWQVEARRLNASGVADARRLLGFVHGNAIASAVGMPTAQTWKALRTIVPHILDAPGGAAAMERSA